MARDPLRLRVFDTLRRRKVPLEPAIERARPLVRLYVCGVTPYDSGHMGHAFTFCTFDILVRHLEASGARVRYVQNVTDVDDPLIERADRDGEDWRELARRETQRYRGDMEALRVLPPAHLIGAVEALPVIERFSARMADRGALYNVDEDAEIGRASCRERVYDDV